MRSPDMNVFKIQIAYFFRENSEVKSFGLISSLYSQLKDVFKTEPQSIPVPEDAPAEIPRCIWNGVNVNLNFSKQRLDASFEVSAQRDWKEVLQLMNEKISSALSQAEIIIDRVGLVTELVAVDKLHAFLENYVNIPQFNVASEANLAWLEKEDIYNIWTTFSINESQNINNVSFDINSFPECKLATLDKNCHDVINECASILERKMSNVL